MMADWIIDHFILIVVVLFAAAWLSSMAFFILEANGRAIVTRLAVVRLWVKPGFIWLFPILDRVVRLPEKRFAPDYPVGLKGRVVSVMGASGLVRLEDELHLWPAVAAGGVLKKDARVKITRRDGAILHCKELK